MAGYNKKTGSGECCISDETSSAVSIGSILVLLFRHDA
jgi:hypothetical protein